MMRMLTFTLPYLLPQALTTRTRQTPDGPIVSPLDAKAALENRDSLAKILYSKVQMQRV